MAAKTNSRPPARPQDQSGAYRPRQRESAEERRSRQTAAAIATQADLKREAAERRERKNDSGS
jgi:hypothetical protein